MLAFTILPMAFAAHAAALPQNVPTTAVTTPFTSTSATPTDTALSMWSTTIADREPTVFTIHPNGNLDKCVGHTAEQPTNGTLVRVAGNNVEAKIWQCYDGLAAQQWFYTDDNRIALGGQGISSVKSSFIEIKDVANQNASDATSTGQCLDFTDASLENGNILQTYQCTDLNTNQLWTV